MPDHLDPTAPVIIGGVGGSGTRLVANLLTAMGFYLGRHFNVSADNLCYSVLFNRPRWLLRRAREDPQSLCHGLAVLTRHLTGDTTPLSADQIVFVEEGLSDLSRPGFTPEQVATLLRACLEPAPVDTPDPHGWGWKEPNAHILLPLLMQYFPRGRYIHVIRHGLDMAFSTNTNQLKIWGAVFGMSPTLEPGRLPHELLEYWTKANTRVLEHRRAYGENRVMPLDFDNLCAAPRQGIAALAKFVGADTNALDLDHLRTMVNRPSSIGRYKSHDLAIFTDTELQGVRNLGFEIDRGLRDRPGQAVE